MEQRYVRTALLIGEDGVSRLRNAAVAVFGLGGVGGHCVEALARSGVKRLHLVDADTVEETNLNRQFIADMDTIGMEKTKAMALRLSRIGGVEVTTQQGFVLPENVEKYLPEDIDFIVDAIDMVSAKIALVEAAKRRNIPIISCMGAGNRLDPCGFYITDLFSTQGCGLARTMRRELRKRGITALPVVCSREPAREPLSELPTAPGKRQTPGSFAPATAAAGLALAGYVLRTLSGVEEIYKG